MNLHIISIETSVGVKTTVKAHVSWGGEAFFLDYGSQQKCIERKEVEYIIMKLQDFQLVVGK